MKIIFLTTGAFIKQARNDLYIDFISKVYETELWSLKKINAREYSIADEIEHYETIESLEDLEQRLQKIEGKKIVITDATLNALGQVCPILKKHGAEIVHIKKDNLQNFLIQQSAYSKPKKGMLNKIKYLIRKTGAYQWWLQSKTKGTCKYDYLLSEFNFFPNLTREYIKTHHVKYDEYLHARTQQPFIKEKYAVFLDSNIPFHQDILIHMNEESVEADKYFRLLNTYFNKIEKQYNLKIVISLHPKSEYDSSTFEGRETIKYQTPNLIQNAKFVITHASTSVLNTVLADKPLVFVYYDEMLQKGTRLLTITTLEYAKQLNATIVDIEQDFDKNLVLKHDQTAYSDFKYKYIVNKSLETQTNESIVLSFLKKIQS